MKRNGARVMGEGVRHMSTLQLGVALTYLVSTVIVIWVVPMLLSDPPAWLVQTDPYDEDRWQEQALIRIEHRRVRSV